MEMILLQVQMDQQKKQTFFFVISMNLFVHLHIIKMCHDRFDVNCDHYGTMLLSKMKTN